MARLLSAGCSLIYGAELSDSPDVDGADPPSSKTWPALYANTRGLAHHTCSACGLSNTGIARYVVDVLETYSFDAVIVQWTFTNRYEFRLNKTDKSGSFFNLITPWMSKEYTNEIGYTVKPPIEVQELATSVFRYIDSDSTQYYLMLKTQFDLANYLRFKNIPFVFTYGGELPENTQSDKSISILENAANEIPFVKFEGSGFYNWAVNNRYPCGDHWHPLDQAHRDAFDLIQHDLDSVLNL